MYVLFLPTAHALSFDSETDGESFATWSLCAAACILLGMLVCAWRSQKTDPVLTGFTQILLFYQFVRWSALIDLDGSAFFYGYWKRVAMLLDPVEVLDTDGEAISSRATAMRVPNPLFLSNAEEQMALLVGCAVTCGLIVTCMPSFRQRNYHYALWSWCYLVSANDVSLFIYFQLSDLTTSTSLGLGSCIVTVTLLVAYLVGFVILFSAVTLGGHQRAFIIYFVQEFQVDKPAVMYLYYPLLLLGRFLTSLGFVYAGGTLQVSIALATEGAIILYVLLINPYKQTRHTLFTFVFHLLEAGALTLPLLYTKDLTSDSTLNFLLTLTVWLMFVVCLLRFILDSFAENTSEQIAPKSSVVRGVITEKVEADFKRSHKVGQTMLDIPRTFNEGDSSPSRDEFMLDEEYVQGKPPVHVPLQFLPEPQPRRPPSMFSQQTHVLPTFSDRPPSLYSNPLSDWGTRVQRPGVPASRASHSTASINDVTVVRAFPQNRM